MHLDLGHAALRAYLPADAARLARHASDPAVAETMADANARQYSATEAAAWIDFVRHQSPACQFAIAADGELVGGIGLEQQTEAYAHSAEIHYWVAPSHWGRGLATTAVRSVTGYAFEALGLVRVYARVFEGNEASRRVLEKCGYALEGRLRHGASKAGRLLDVFLYARLRTAVM